jgi:hypothetical protein
MMRDGLVPDAMVLLAAVVTACAAAPNGHTYKYTAGTLPVGDDVIPAANYTLAEAEAKCSSLTTCAGITFKAPIATPVGTVRVYLKDAGTQGVLKSAGWQTYMRDDYVPNPMSKGKQIPGPTNPSDLSNRKAWHANMQIWRRAYKNFSKYTGAVYDDPQLTWTQTLAAPPPHEITTLMKLPILTGAPCMQVVYAAADASMCVPPPSSSTPDACVMPSCLLSRTGADSAVADLMLSLLLPLLLLLLLLLPLQTTGSSTTQ